MWKRTIFENYPINTEKIYITSQKFFHRVIHTKNPATFLYKYLLNNRNDQPFERADRWSTDLGVFIEDLDLYKALYESYSCTK